MSGNDLDERLAALIESYAEAASWRVIDDDDGPGFGFAYDRYRVAVEGAPGGDDWGWTVWTIEPSDDWVRLRSERGCPTAPEATADALGPLIGLIWPKGSPGAEQAEALGANDMARRAVTKALDFALETRCQATIKLVPGEGIRATLTLAPRGWNAEAEEGPSP